MLKTDEIMFWLIKKWLKKLKETTQDPRCCYIKAKREKIVSIFKKEGFLVDVFEFQNIEDFLKGITIGIHGTILEEYRGEDIAAVKPYISKEEIKLAKGKSEWIGVKKRLHIRFWKTGDDNYLVKAHTEFDVTDPRHILEIGINFEQGCKWFKRDIKDTDIKII